MIENTILHRVVCVYEVVHLKIAHVSWPGARWAGERWEQLLRSTQPGIQWPSQWTQVHSVTRGSYHHQYSDHHSSICILLPFMQPFSYCPEMNSLPVLSDLSSRDKDLFPTIWDFLLWLDCSSAGPWLVIKSLFHLFSQAQGPVPAPTLASLTMHKHIFTLIEFEIIITSWCYENLSPLFNLFESASWFLRKYNSFKIEIPVETPLFQSLKGAVLI